MSKLLKERKVECKCASTLLDRMKDEKIDDKTIAPNKGYNCIAPCNICMCMNIGYAEKEKKP